MSEISDFALLVLAVTGGLSVALAATRLPLVPAPVVLLVAAALVSDVFPDVGSALAIRDVSRIAVVALIVILFNGGLDIGWRRMRASIGPVLSLGILGTFATALVVAAAGHWLLGFSWTLAGVLGAALAPTDPAVMFSVRGGRDLRGRTGTVLEGEAGFNDPAGIALMIGMVELATHPGSDLLTVAREFVVEMGVGAVLGVLGGRLLALAHPRGATVLLLLAGVLYGATSLVGGSGFLAVFVAGLLIGDREAIAERQAYASIAAMGEVVVFVALGVTIGITDLSWETWRDGLVLAALIAVVARPLAVAVTLARARLTGRERLFVMWAGLKGAVPILLAAFAILGGVRGAHDLYGIVFVVVAINVLVQGTLVPWVASRLDVAA